MPDYTPIHDGGSAPFTSQAGATIIGGQLLAVSGNNQVSPAGVTSKGVVGVAGHDTATGKKVAVWPLPGVTHEIVNTAIVAAGDILAPGAAGAVTPIAAGTFEFAIGTAVAGAANGALTRFIGR